MKTIEQHIAKYIENKKPTYDYLATYRKNIGALNYPQLTDIDVRTCFANKVVFISDRPNYHFLRVSKALNDDGTDTILLTRWGVPEEQKRFFSNIILYDKFADLKQITAADNCKFYVQSWVGWNFLFCYISTLTNQAVYCNTNDLSNLLLTDNKYFDLINLSADEAKADLAFELKMLEDAELVTTPYESEALKTLPIEQSRLGRNIVTFPTYPLEEFCNDKARKLNVEPKLLYAGMVPFDDRPDIVFSDAKMQEPVKVILEQGLSLTILNNPQHTKTLDNKMLLERYRYFSKLTETFPNFAFTDGFMPWQLKKQVADFDFGTILHSFSTELVINPTHYERILPSKIFTYIEANLPIIIVDNFKAISDLIKKHNLGIVISGSDIPHLKEIINSHADQYPEYLEAIKNYRTKFNIRNMLTLLRN